jgi:hypothetical protein
VHPSPCPGCGDRCRDGWSKGRAIASPKMNGRSHSRVEKRRRAARARRRLSTSEGVGLMKLALTADQLTYHDSSALELGKR